MSGHPSRMVLDLALIGAASAEDAAHVAGCARCSELLGAMRAQDAAFLRAHPGPVEKKKAASGEAVPPVATSRSWSVFGSRSGEAVPPVATSRSWSVFGSRSGEAVPPVATSRSWLAVAAAAAILIVALIFRPGSPETRMKGETSAELLVQRGGATFSYDGRPLAEGDTLLFRYTSLRKYLLVIDSEASGKIEAVIERAIEPGQDKLAPDGVRLDDYRGRERIIAIFSDRPLDAAPLIDALKKGEPLPALEGADEKTWHFEKGAP